MLGIVPWTRRISRKICPFLPCFVPVSYTHLDVYKRQTEYINRPDKDRTTLRINNYLRHIREELLEESDNILKNPNKGNNGIVQIKANINGIAVSYTHLDVYKRQV